MSKKYQITVSPVDVTEPGNLQFLSRVPGDGIIASDYIDTDVDGNEVYEIEVSDDYAGFVESQCELTDGVVAYFQI